MSAQLAQLMEAIGPLADEAEKRSLKTTKVDVIDYKPDPSQTQVTLTIPGTLTLFIARANSKILGEIRQAAKKRDEKQILDITSRLRKQFEARRPMTLAEAANEVIAQPVFAEARYKEKSLAKSLYVPKGLDVCVVPLPYNGGKIRAQDLALTQFLQHGKNDLLEVVAVKHSPVLSKLEKDALRLVPVTDLSSNIGNAAMCYAITGVAIVAAVMGATSFCVGRVGLPEDPIINPIIKITSAQVEKLGPAQTARQLLEVRRQALRRLSGGAF
jgi:hypothetical protein